MCRMFGFSASRPAAVHRALLDDSNALKVQSQDHPDGWGIGYYPEDESAPLVVRSINAAFADAEFAEAATRVKARTVIAHVRRASCGPVALDNTHPFHHGRWMFAHNGTVSRFAEVRAALEAEIAPDLRGLARGDTDSERCFLLILTHLGREVGLDGSVDAAQMCRALLATVATVRRVADPGADEPSSLTFLLSNGPILVAYRSGRSLHYARTAAVPTSASADAAFRPGDELLIASEVLSAERDWAEVPEGGLVGIDADRRLVLHPS